MRTSDTKSVARAVLSTLGRDILAPATSRLLWVPLHLSVFLAAVVLVRSWLGAGRGIVQLLPVSVLVGFSFAGLAFVAHEALHGALTRRRNLARFVGWFGFLPFCVVPRLWVAWHNRVHHGNTNVAGVDPDAYPTEAEARASRVARLAVQWGAPRSGKWRGIITLALGFTLQSLQVLVFAGARGHLTRREHWIALLQTAFGFGLWAIFGALVGVEVFLVTYVVPLMVANAIVMAHIITNHSLSPLAPKNDALATSLTVTVPEWFEFYSLGFGYHVEHHLFPAMSNRHAPLVQKELRRLVPHRYQELSFGRALWLLFTTPRIYRTSTLLCDLYTGETFETLGSRTPDFDVEVSGSELLVKLDQKEGAEGDKPWASVDVVAATRDTRRISSIPPPPYAA